MLSTNLNRVIISVYFVQLALSSQRSESFFSTRRGTISPLGNSPFRFFLEIEMGKTAYFSRGSILSMPDKVAVFATEVAWRAIMVRQVLE